MVETTWPPLKGGVFSISHMAGVDTVSAGRQAGEPVVRGLTGNRVRVLHDGVPQDFQQFGIRHAPTVDPVNVYRIDVVRGPMSVIFGSDASGMGRNIQLSLSAQLR
jgi:iron complex outermembrane receptor protein/hemoglobin/transferrin/lactoferrin receptor protein